LAIVGEIMHRDATAVIEGLVSLFRHDPFPLALCLAERSELVGANDAFLQLMGLPSGSATEPVGLARLRSSPEVRRFLREARSLADHGERDMAVADRAGNLRSYRIAVETREVSSDLLCLIRVRQSGHDDDRRSAPLTETLRSGPFGVCREGRPEPDRAELLGQLDEARAREACWKNILNDLPFSLTIREPEGRLLFANRATADEIRTVAAGLKRSTLVVGSSGSAPEEVSQLRRLPFVVLTQFPRPGQSAVLRLGSEVSSPAPSSRDSAGESRVAEEKVRNIERLSAAFSHRANNLLTAVLGNVDLASLKLSDDSPLLTYLGGIRTATDQLSALWQQALLCIRPPQEGPEPLSLARLLREMVPLLELIVGKHSTMTYDVPSAVPAVLGHNGDFRQLLLSMVGALHRAVDAAPGTMRLRCAVHNGEGVVVPSEGDEARALRLELSFAPHDSHGEGWVAPTLPTDEVWLGLGQMVRLCGGDLSHSVDEATGIIVRADFSLHRAARASTSGHLADGDSSEVLGPH
jgi:hypothetical protein